MPSGRTMTGTRLDGILRAYFKGLELNKDTMENVKPLNIIVITDGEPHDDVESVVIQAARKLDKLDAPPYQLGIQFFQVGNDPKAAKSLAELDDEICKAKDLRDIVDTVPMGPDGFLSSEKILKTLLGAVVKKWDRHSV